MFHHGTGTQLDLRSKLLNMAWKVTCFLFQDFCFEILEFLSEETDVVKSSFERFRNFSLHKKSFSLKQTRQLGFGFQKQLRKIFFQVPQ
jgi:hypothetical protein